MYIVCVSIPHDDLDIDFVTFYQEITKMQLCRFSQQEMLETKKVKRGCL